jgi:integrase
VPIHHQLYPFLTAYGAEEGKQGQLFNFKRDKDGKCVKAATKALDPYIKAARFDNGVFVKHLKTHGLRGTFTTACYSAGVNDSMRRFLGGWRQLGDDKTYLHPDLDAENEMLQKINFDHICCA